jgi:beta-lactamase class A
LAGVKRLALRAATVMAAVAAPVRLAGQDVAALGARLAARIARTPHQGVGVYYRRLDRPDSLLRDADRRFHAASTMKLPVLIQAFRDADAGTLRLDERWPVVNRFRSLVDGSPYALDPADDSDSSLYARVGGTATVRELLDLMITVSSNLATNLVIARLGAARVTATARALGADSIAVLRGVEDEKAYRAGRNNTTTARDLGVLLAAIARRRAASPAACDSMLAILGRQRFTEGIPAGLPPGARVYHKTGWVPQVVYHDAAYVELPGGARYVLVVATGGIADDTAAYRLVADVSRLVAEAAGRR